MTTPPRPELIINYAPELDLRFTFAELLSYGGAASPDYRLEMDCCVRHSTGTFRYTATDIHFEPKAVQRFAEQLERMRRGLTRQAALSDPGEMVVFRLEGDSRKLLANVDVRQGLSSYLATLHVPLEVDYDLFVNKLHREVERFVEELSHIDPSRPE
jgi:hypothetical protein